MTVIYKQTSDIFDMAQHAIEIKNRGQADLGFGRSPAMSFDESSAIGLQGGYWPEGTKDIAPVEMPLDALQTNDMLLPRVEAAVVGGRVNVPAMLSGSPVSMYRVHQSHKVKRVIRLGVDIGGNCRIESETLYNRGSAVLSAVDTLNAAGFAVEVTALQTFCTDNDSIILETLIKEADRSWSPDSFAFALANDAFFRHFGWYMVADMVVTGDKEQRAAAKRVRYSGLGNGTRGEALKLPERYDLFFPYITDNAPYNSPESARATVRDYVNNRLNAMAEAA
jgi:hypothetical protein